MAEQDNGAAGATDGQPQSLPQVKMQILGQYVRDMSFENILAQKPVEGQVQPDIQVQVSIDAKKRDENRYEVTTKFKVTSKNREGGQHLFLMELDYSGLFAIEGVPEGQLHPFLLIECPRMMFPFVRRIVSDVTRDGGFPPLNLDNIDFVQLYRQTLAQRQAAASQAEGTRVS